MTIDHIINNTDEFEILITHSTFEDYIKIYSKQGAWNNTSDGNDIMVPALAAKLGINIIIYNEVDGSLVRRMDVDNDDALSINLSSSGAHYNPYVASSLTHLEAIRDSVMAYSHHNQSPSSNYTFFSKAEDLSKKTDNIAVCSSSVQPK